MIYIYVISARDNGPCKIGFSNEPEERLKQLQTCHPEPLRLHFTAGLPAKKAKLIEQIIHKTIKHDRSHGEWFNLTVQQAVDEVTYAVIRYEDDPILRDYL